MGRARGKGSETRRSRLRRCRRSRASFRSSSSGRHEREQAAALARPSSTRLRRRRSVRAFSTRSGPVRARRERGRGCRHGAVRRTPAAVDIRRRLRPGRRSGRSARRPRRRSGEATRVGCRTSGSRRCAPLGTDWRKPHIEDAPYVVVVFEQAYGLRPDGSKVKHYYVKESVGIAVGFLLASLHRRRARHADAHAEPDGLPAARSSSGRRTSGRTS